MSKNESYEEENKALKKQIAELEAKKENEALKARLNELSSEETEKLSSDQDTTEKSEDNSVLHNDTTLTKKRNRKFKLNFKSPLHVLTLGIVLAVGLALLLHFVIAPAFTANRLNNDLTNIKNMFGAIKAGNTETVNFKGETIENTNSLQKALSVNGEKPTTPASFIFSNGNESGEKQRVDLYVDFSSQKSRDFIVLNQDGLKALVENGKINLYIHPMLSERVFSIYGPEALAEAFYYNEGNEWEFLIKILVLSNEVNSSSLAPAEVAEKLEDIAKDSNAGAINKESIQNGTFVSWLLTGGDDDKLSLGVTLPAIFIDNAPVSTQDVDINDGNFLQNALRKQANK